MMDEDSDFEAIRRAILREWIENPDATRQEIADGVDCPPSYVALVLRDAGSSDRDSPEDPAVDPPSDLLDLLVVWPMELVLRSVEWSVRLYLFWFDLQMTLIEWTVVLIYRVAAAAVNAPFRFADRAFDAVFGRHE